MVLRLRLMILGIAGEFSLSKSLNTGKVHALTVVLFLMMLKRALRGPENSVSSTLREILHRMRSLYRIKYWQSQNSISRQRETDGMDMTPMLSNMSLMNGTRSMKSRKRGRS